MCERTRPTDDRISGTFAHRVATVGPTPDESSPTLELTLLREIPDETAAVRAVRQLRRHSRRVAELQAEVAHLERKLVLSTRKQAIIELMRNGKSGREIAAELGLSPAQVSQMSAQIRSDYEGLGNTRAHDRRITGRIRRGVSTVKNLPPGTAEMFESPEEREARIESEPAGPILTRNADGDIRQITQVMEDGTELTLDLDALEEFMNDNPETESEKVLE